MVRQPPGVSSRSELKIAQEGSVWWWWWWGDGGAGGWRCGAWPLNIHCQGKPVLCTGILRAIMAVRLRDAPRALTIQMIT